MAYDPTEWVDEVPNETPQHYVINGANSDCTIEPKTAPTPGTPLNATNLNHIEEGIAAIEALTKIPVTHRQGGATDWGDNYGTNNYDVSAVPQIMQVGCSHVLATGDLIVTFPVPFSHNPIVVIGANEGVSVPLIIMTSYVTPTTFHLSAWTVSGARAQAFFVHWIAVGPA